MTVYDKALLKQLESSKSEMVSRGDLILVQCNLTPAERLLIEVHQRLMELVDLTVASDDEITIYCKLINEIGDLHKEYTT